MGGGGAGYLTEETVRCRSFRWNRGRSLQGFCGIVSADENMNRRVGLYKRLGLFLLGWYQCPRNEKKRKKASRNGSLTWILVA